ncbi:hypothetical protein ACP70R_025318 [Stipagrostis hirtigluma subsp. patula]
MMTQNHSTRLPLVLGACRRLCSLRRVRPPHRPRARALRCFQARSPTCATGHGTSGPLISSSPAGRWERIAVPCVRFPNLMYWLRVATGGGTGLGFALGRLGGVSAAPGLVPPTAAASLRGRSVSATSAVASPVSGDQGVGMDQPKEQQPPRQQDAAAGEKKTTRAAVHRATWDVMAHSFGEGYSTRSEEEGFGGVYGRGDPDETEHTGHHEYDTSQGSEVKEKERARHFKDATHAA